MKRLFRIFLSLSLALLVGCAAKPADSSILFDGEFAQTALTETIPSENLPQDRDGFLALWGDIDPAERERLRTEIVDDFSNGVLSVSVYVNEHDRLVFTPDAAETYTICVNDGAEHWSVTAEELS